MGIRNARAALGSSGSESYGSHIVVKGPVEALKEVLFGKLCVLMVAGASPPQLWLTKGHRVVVKHGNNAEQPEALFRWDGLKPVREKHRLCRIAAR